MMVHETKAKARVRALREVGKEKWEKKSCLPKVDMCGPATITLWAGSCNLGPRDIFCMQISHYSTTGRIVLV